MNTPEGITRIIKELSGIAVHGQIEQDGINSYAALQDDLRIVCTPTEGGWLVAAGLANAGPARFWSNRPDTGTAIAIQLLGTFMRPQSGDLQPTFRKVMHDVGGVIRQTFDTSIGAVVVHSRKVPSGTDIVIEVVNTKSHLQLLWEAATGGIDPQNAKTVDIVPF